MLSSRMSVLALSFLAALFLLSPSLYAKTCEFSLQGSDQMKYDKKEWVIPQECSDVKLVLKHVGRMSKAMMGHNVVISKTSDVAGINTDAMNPKKAKEYVPQNDQRVLVHTKLIGGGESDTITFKKRVLKAGYDYSFFCSFPGHVGMMIGKIVVK
jgi:azurin